MTDESMLIRTRATTRKIGVAAIVLIASLAAAGLCAQPMGGKPLTEGAVLGGIDGKLLHVDANDTWWFELAAEFRNDVYRVPAGTRFVLLPSSTLEQLIADVNDRYTPQYRLAGQVARYGGANFLLVTYFLPLSKFKGDGKTQDGGQKAEDERPGLPAGSGLAIPPEIVERLKNQRPVRAPLRKPGTTNPNPAPAPRDYLGRTLVDKVGMIETAGRKPGTGSTSSLQPPACGYFIPYALGWNVASVRYELLPCGVLEQALQMQRSSMEPIRFNVAGLITQFKGRQYLLLRRAVPVYNYGNFGR